MNLLLVEYEVFAALLLAACFCRLTRITKRNIRRPLRWIFTALAITGTVCLVGPLLTGYRPTGGEVALLGLLAVLQVATAPRWNAGVPADYQQEAP